MLSSWRLPSLMWLLSGMALTLAAVPVSAQGGQAAGPSRDDEVVATIGDETIRLRDLKNHWRTQDAMSFARVEQQVYEAEKRALDSLIGEYLIRNEAKRQNLSVDDLLARTLPALTAPVTDDDIKQVYERSPAASQGVTLDQSRVSITTYLQRQRRGEARGRYVDELRTKGATPVVIKLDTPRQTVKVAMRNPAIGPAAAPVEIVESSDFECAFCKGTAPLLKQLLSKYGDRVRLVWKDFPLSNHPSARPAAEAAACAHDQGKFWAYHDALFANQATLMPANLVKYAGDVGLDVSAFKQCFDSGKHRDDVIADGQEARFHGVSATPTIFINGRRVTGARPLETYEQIIREELGMAKPVSTSRR